MAAAEGDAPERLKQAQEAAQAAEEAEAAKEEVRAAVALLVPASLPRFIFASAFTLASLERARVRCLQREYAASVLVLVPYARARRRAALALTRARSWRRQARKMEIRLEIMALVEEAFAKVRVRPSLPSPPPARKPAFCPFVQSQPHQCTRPPRARPLLYSLVNELKGLANWWVLAAHRGGGVSERALPRVEQRRAVCCP